MPLVYLPPTFNLTCDVWHDGTPLTDPPDLSPQCQLYFHSRADLPIHPTNFEEWIPPLYLRVPIGTDLRAGDIVECAQGDNWRYIVRWVERVHRGFPNEYFVGLLAGIPDGPSPSNLSTGTHLLASTGTNVITATLTGGLPDGFMLIDIAMEDGTISVVSVDVEGVNFPIHTNFSNGTLLLICHVSNAFVDNPAGNLLTVTFSAVAPSGFALVTILDAVSNPIPWRKTHNHSGSTVPFTNSVDTSPKSGCYIDAAATWLGGGGAGPNYVTPTNQAAEAGVPGSFSARLGWDTNYPAAPIALLMDAATFSEWAAMLTVYH